MSRSCLDDTGVVCRRCGRVRVGKRRRDQQRAREVIIGHCWTVILPPGHAFLSMGSSTPRPHLGRRVRHFIHFIRTPPTSRITVALSNGRNKFFRRTNVHLHLRQRSHRNPLVSIGYTAFRYHWSFIDFSVGRINFTTRSEITRS